MKRLADDPDKTSKESFIVAACIATAIPFSKLEHPVWKAALKKCEIHMHTRNCLMNTNLPAIYKVVIEEPIQRLKVAESVTVSFDGWKRVGEDGGMKFSFIVLSV